MWRSLVFALLVLSCGRVDDSVPATGGTAGHSLMPAATGGVVVATGGVAIATGGVSSASGGLGASDSGGAAPRSGGASSYASSDTAGTTGGSSSTPDSGYPIVEVPLTCAHVPDICGYMSDGFGGLLYCGPCPCTVTCEEVCASSDPNGTPRCVTDYDSTRGYISECPTITGCNDLRLRRCWCKRT
jgi:hypothetical protein